MNGLEYSQGITEPKVIAIIKFLGGAFTLYISDVCDFTPPTKEQRKNLKEMLCIDVELLDEEEDDETD